MEGTNFQRVAELRKLIGDFLTKRLNDKLEKIKGDSEQAQTDRQRERDRFQMETWLDSAAGRCRQIQVVTHTLKATHPDPKITEATNLYVIPSEMMVHAVVGSHTLGGDFLDDATGNAAALDVYDFLSLEHQSRTVLDMVRANDPELIRALSEDFEKASNWVRRFAEVVRSPCAQTSSHTLAKQVYWHIGNDPHDDNQYHLLAPLYASSLAHRVWSHIQDDRYGDEAKAARQARDRGDWSDRPVREYPQLAVQQLGGTKPQNISRLNSVRRGNNYLLASLPPTWHSIDVRPLFRTDSMFKRYEHRNQVREALRSLWAFLKSDPIGNFETRQRRAELVDTLIDELLQFAGELHTLAPGWSQEQDCWLRPAERHWLDPDGVAKASETIGRPLPTDTAEQISAGFANWLNARLRDMDSRAPLAMGDPEFLEWRRRVHELIQANESGASNDD